MCDWPSVIFSASRLFESAEFHSIGQTHENATPTQIIFQLICDNYRGKKHKKMMLNIELAILHLSIHYEV